MQNARQFGGKLKISSILKRDCSYNNIKHVKRIKPQILIIGVFLRIRNTLTQQFHFVLELVSR